MGRSRRRVALLALPSLAWFIGFLVIPLFIVSVYSFLTKGPYGGIVYTVTLWNYERITDPVYIKIIFQSFKFAASTTIVCLLLGFPTAYVMATSSRRMRSVFLLLVMLPFLSNFVVRAFAIKVLLSIDGPLSRLLFAFNIINAPTSFNNTGMAVWFGMITNYLPFMILPIYVNLERFDFTLIEAAHDLGAKGIQTIWKVLLPLAKPGIVAGSILVFIPCLGEYIIPDLLGGAQSMFLGNLITDQFLKARDWPFGSALSVVIILTTIALFAFERYLRERAVKFIDEV
jgi:spermidine/putrescine transport system permease protein